MQAESSTVIGIVLGGVLGAVLSPACEALVNTFLQKDKANVNDGIMLLCFSNAVWLVSMLISSLFQANALANLTLLILYVISALLLISCFHALRRPQAMSITPLTKKLLLCLIASNLLWIMSDMSEILTMIFDSADSIYVSLKILFSSLSFIILGYGVRLYFTENN